jgi:hypothetical protein
MSITTLKSAAKNNSTQEQFFEEHIVKQKASGLSRAAYCRKHQLNYDHFNYWFRKEKKTAQQLVPIKISEPVKPSSLRPIALPTLCTLTLTNGDVLQIHDKSILPLIFSKLN